MPLAVKINVALREQNCQKIGSKRVNIISISTRILSRINVVLDDNHMLGPSQAARSANHAQFTK